MKENPYHPNMLIYEDHTMFFNWNVPDRYNFAWDIDRKWGKDKTKIALITVDPDGKNAKKMTFWELQEASNKFCNVLMDIGIRKGDHVLLMLPRSEEWYIALMAMIKIGAVAIPTTTQVKVHDIEYRLKQGACVMVITDREGSDKIEDLDNTSQTLAHKILAGQNKQGWYDFDELMNGASHELQSHQVESTNINDPLLLYFTSGTTGNPKMVMHTHAYPLALRETAFCCQDLKPIDIIWTIADTGWAKFAWGKLFGQWLIGATVLQWNIKGRFDPDVALHILTNYGVSVFCSPPTVYRMIISQCDMIRYDFSELRHCMSAGEPLNPEVIRIWKAVTGNDIFEYYGQTETVALISNFRCKPIKPGSMGFPVPGYDVDIIDETGKPVHANEEGYIAVKVKPDHPPGIFHGYWKDENKTEEVFRYDWYITGDKARKDEDGYFWFIGRDDDIIKASGYRIGPFEVESALIKHRTVKECAVIGIPDHIRGQIVKAFVVLKPGLEPSPDLVRELQEHVKGVTAPYKYPRMIEFMQELPKTLSGKIKRSELKRKEILKYQSEGKGFESGIELLWKEQPRSEEVDV